MKRSTNKVDSWKQKHTGDYIDRVTGERSDLVHKNIYFILIQIQSDSIFFFKKKLNWTDLIFIYYGPTPV